MSGNLWIIFGLLSGVFSLYAVPHGFSLRDAEEKQGFALTDSSFDMVLVFPPNTIQTFRTAFPQENGNLTVIFHISEEGVPEHYARIQLAGQWNGTSGFIPQFSEDLVVFNLSDHRFFLFHKKPIIEHVPATLSRLKEGKRYRVDITAFPGFAIPLIPEKLQIRTHEGQLYNLTSITGSDRGWYSARLSF